MKLYIVDFQYRDVEEEKDVSDRWTLACEDRLEVEKTMQINFDELERFGYIPISYTSTEVDKTDNGYKVTPYKI